MVAAALRVAAMCGNMRRVYILLDVLAISQALILNWHLLRKLGRMKQVSLRVHVQGQPVTLHQMPATVAAPPTASRCSRSSMVAQNQQQHLLRRAKFRHEQRMQSCGGVGWCHCLVLALALPLMGCLCCPYAAGGIGHAPA
jgi:hypothetical protein